MKITVADIVNELNWFAPLSYQESYDNSGLILGEPGTALTGALLSTDTTEAVVREAIEKSCNLIVSHHPIIFKGLKRITGSNYVERTVMFAIKHSVAVYAGHTSFDVAYGGVNSKIADKLGLKNRRVLLPRTGTLKKLVTFVPGSHLEQVRMALFDAGAGEIGNYDQCSYAVSGKGSFRAGEGTNPYSGEMGKLHFEEEFRLETIFPAHLYHTLIQALVKAHPYEEVAFDVYPLDMDFQRVGLGMVGELKDPMDEITFLNTLKNTFASGCIRHSPLLGKPVSKVAVCGGAGSELLHHARSAGADIFVTADMKYHQFFDAEDQLVIADIGHYESEQFTREIFYDLLKKKFPKFAVHFSEVNTNPIKYY